MEWNRAKSPAEFAARRRQKNKSIFHRNMRVGGKIILVIPREQRGPGESVMPLRKELGKRVATPVTSVAGSQ